MSQDGKDPEPRPSYMFTYIPPEALRSSLKYVNNIGSAAESFIYMRLPPDGGWAWVILLFSFLAACTTDGILLCIGHLLPEIGTELELNNSKTSLISSAQHGLYCLIGPVGSAAINKLGFRTVGISGAFISAAGMFGGSIAKSYPLLLFLYGFCVGIGFGLIYAASQLIVGYYFEKYRAIAAGICCAGSGFGTLVFSPLNQFLIIRLGWRHTLQVHGGMCVSIALMCLVFRPVPPKKIAAILPPRENTMSGESIVISSAKYVTAKDTESTDVSFISTTKSILDKYESEEGCCTNCSPCCRKPKPRESGRMLVDAGPLYRDDIFYAGSLSSLPEYKKSIQITSEIPGEFPEPERRSLHYALSVTKIASSKSPKRRNKCHRIPDAIKDGFLLLFDISILKLFRFQLVLLSEHFLYMGSNIPYLFLTRRAKLPEPYPNWLLPALGVMNVIFRIGLGLVAFKLKHIDPAYITGPCLIFGGFVGMMSSEIGHNWIWFQFLFCIGFALSLSSNSSLRTVIFVNLLGLSKLTNAFGITSLFMGIAICSGTTIGGVLVDATDGYDAAFQFAGWAFLLSGVTQCYIPYIQRQALKQKTGDKRVHFEN